MENSCSLSPDSCKQSRNFSTIVLLLLQFNRTRTWFKSKRVKIESHLNMRALIWNINDYLSRRFFLKFGMLKKVWGDSFFASLKNRLRRHLRTSKVSIQTTLQQFQIWKKVQFRCYSVWQWFGNFQLYKKVFFLWEEKILKMKHFADWGILNLHHLILILKTIIWTDLNY